MIEDDEYRVIMLPLPGDIHGAVRMDKDGYPTVYINDRLAPAARRRAYRHESRHIRLGDHYSGLSIQAVEKEDDRS